MAQNIRSSSSRPKVIPYFPTKAYGQEGDIVVSKIPSKGVFLCIKAGGLWYAQTTMQPLQKINTSYIKNLSSDKMTIKRLENAKVNTDKFIVSENGDIKYRTAENILSDLGLEGINPFDIAYKTAYCSLEQYSDKETCKANGGTWYYSENDSHDNISSTAENQLLTVSQSIGNVDAESKLTYNGSVLEVKSAGSNYDDNWPPKDDAGTITEDKLLQLTKDSSNYAFFEFDSSKRLNLIIKEEDDSTAGGEFKIKGKLISGVYQGQFTFKLGVTSLQNDILSNKHLRIETSASGIDLHPFNGNVKVHDGADNSIIELDANNTHIRLKDDTSTSDYFDIEVGAEGATTISTVDAGSTVGHLALRPDGDLILAPASQKTIISATDGLYFDGGGDTYIAETSADNLRFVVGGVNMLDMTEVATPSVNIQNSYLTIDTGKRVVFDGSVLGHTYITESGDDILDFYVGAKKMLALDEANGKITLATANLVAAIADGTEYSATNSAYAGMILGYTCIGANVADDSYTLTTSYVCFADSGGTAIRTSFTTPPSENVEIEVELYFSAGSGASDLELTLSDNAVYGGNSLTNPLQFDKSVREPARGHSGTVTQKWLLQADNLEAIGSSNSIYIAAKCDSTTGTPIIRWGGDASGEYTNLVMKAVALPAAIAVGS